ncbi:MAG: hypothetical protein AAGF95_21020 [Chloroflexota bacterium]
MSTRWLRIVAVCTFVLVPLVTIIVVHQIFVYCLPQPYGCPTQHELLFKAIWYWLDYGPSYTLSILIIYGALSVVRSKMSLFPTTIAKVAPLLVMFALIADIRSPDWMFLVPVHLTAYGLFLGMEMWRQHILIRYSTYGVTQNAKP